MRLKRVPRGLSMTAVVCNKHRPAKPEFQPMRRQEDAMTRYRDFDRLPSF